MKVKLLRKIRKRYSITHYPNGYYQDKDFFEGPITILRDSEDSWRYLALYHTKSEAYDILYKTLLHWIEKDYDKLRSKKTKITSEVLWYNTNKK
jgi:hypothetical protein